MASASKNTKGLHLQINMAIW